MFSHSSTTSSKGPKPTYAPPHSPTGQSSRSHTPADEKRQENVNIGIHPIAPTTPKESNPLTVFHTALGIPAAKTAQPSRNFFGRKKSVQEPVTPQISRYNKGVYHEVRSCERWAHIRYTGCDSIVTISMFLQIIVGASVTAFGAGSANHIIITVFGAANTALASLLAVLKSQGLPNRLRQDWNVWRELREYIEEKEREIEMAINGKIPEGQGKVNDVWAEIKGIEARYNAARVTSEANRPDTYIRPFDRSFQVPAPVLPK